MLQVSRSGYYEWKEAVCSFKAKRDAVLLAQIRQIERDNHGLYGVRRVHRALNDEYIAKAGKSRVQRIMSQYGIKAKTHTKFKPQTTKADPKETAFENLLGQNFGVLESNQIWLSDITYLRVGGKWSYLAVVLDLYDRKPVGWSLGSRPTAELACMAMHRALMRRKPPKGLIHHSDRGSQYTSHDYRELLEKHKVQGSMSRKGNPYDNAPMESFFKTLKTEWTNWFSYRSMDEALSSLFYYIDVYYCCKRLHSALGYIPPKNYEKRSLPAV